MKAVRLDIIVQEGGGYVVYSEDRSKRLSRRYRTLGEAQKRLAQIEYFKSKKARLDALSPEERRKQVAHEIVLHRTFGGLRKALKRKPRVLPQARSPKTIAVEYAKALRAMFRAARAAYQPVIDALNAARVREDADFPAKVKSAARQNTEFSTKIKMQGREAHRLLDEAERRMESAVSKQQVETLASKFAARTSTYQRMQLGRQVKAALGADPYMRDPVLAGKTEDFVAHNVSLIKRIPTRLHEKIEGLVMNSVAKSELNVNLAATIQEQFGIAERHANLIARDQIAKYYGAVNRARQRELGVSKFIWRTVNDERVRDSHAELEGEEFSWDDLPTNERGEEIYPGSDYQCRCSAEPVLDDLLDDVEDATDDLNPEIDIDQEQDED